MGLCRFCAKQTKSAKANSVHCVYHRGVIHKLRNRAVKDSKYTLLKYCLANQEVAEWLFHVSEELLGGPMPIGLKDLDWDYFENMVDLAYA